MAEEFPCVVNARLTIPERELTWRFSASGGPGGQHANTANTRAEVSFSVADSAVLSPGQRQRLVERYGPVITGQSSSARSQLRNRELALERLAERIRAGLRTTAVRRPTAPTAGSRRRRLQAKRHRSSIKQTRSRPSSRDWD